MKSIFSNSLLDKDLLLNGFVKIPFLKIDEVNKIKEVYFTKKIEDHNTYDVNVERNEPYTFEDFKEIRNEIEPIISNALSTISNNLQIVFVEFLSKKAGKGNIPGHQDWVFTDSIDYPSISIFIALSDIKLENGSLGFVKGSHKISELIPPPSPSPYAPLPLIEHSKLIARYLNYQEQNTGEAIFFFNNTIHGSEVNFTEEDRIVLRVAVCHKEASLIHNYLDPNSVYPNEMFIQYLVDKDFYITYRNERLVSVFKNKSYLPYKEIKRLPYLYPVYLAKDLEVIFKSFGNIPMPIKENFEPPRKKLKVFLKFFKSLFFTRE